MTYTPPLYKLLTPEAYLPYIPDLKEKLDHLQDNYVTYNKEIHRDSRFAICHYKIDFAHSQFDLEFDEAKSQSASKEKKTNSDPTLLNSESVKSIITRFLLDIGDQTLKKVEVKLIQTKEFPFMFNPHRDSQFRRLKYIKYLATLLVSCAGIRGGNMQLFRSENDQLGPFHVIEELPTLPGTGYIVIEPPHEIFHGMNPAFKVTDEAHRGALLLRFYD